jgi:hypothetical protein
LFILSYAALTTIVFSNDIYASVVAVLTMSIYRVKFCTTLLQRRAFTVTRVAFATTTDPTPPSCGCQQPTTDCAYHNLKVPPTSTAKQIKQAYYLRCRECHPDASGTSASSETFLRVQQAYERIKQARPPRIVRAGLCPFAPIPSATTSTANVRKTGFAAFVERNSYRPNDPRYRGDPGLDFEYANSGGQAEPRYMTNQNFRLIVLVIGLIGAAMQYWRFGVYADWATERLNAVDANAARALAEARARARALGWEGQRRELEARIAAARKSSSA